MDASFRAYTNNKLISLGWVFVVIALSALWLGYTETQWQFILLTIMTFGYAHFIVGFIYQWKSFFKKPKPSQHAITFTVLTVATIVLTELLFSFAGYALALFIGFAYFLLHGLFNEQTLIQREGGIHVPLTYIWSLAIFIMSLLTYTIPDPTFLFDRALQFMSVDSFILQITLANIGLPISAYSYVFWIGMGLSFLVLWRAWSKTKNHQLTVFLATSYTVIILATALVGALPYVYMYFLVVGYHFMTWFLFFIRQMHGRGHPVLQNFLLLHILVLAPFLVAGYLFFEPNTPAWAMTLFDYKFFVIATYVHISTSFMNDEWFQVLQNKVFKSG